MKNEDTSIHEMDVNVICNFFLEAERQGPGSPEATLRAIRHIELPGNEAKIADLGCGTGGQTMTLAEQLTGHITALDLFPAFVERVNKRAIQKGVADRVQGVVGSMDALPFEPESLDLIWCEGAIYNIGFRKGLQLWHRHLKPGGYVAVTDATWFTPERPEEIQQFWDECYSEMNTAAHKIAQMREAGYEPIATFSLAEECWTTNYYDRLRPLQTGFLANHPDNETAKAFIDFLRHEEELYRKYRTYYGYQFYIGRKL